MKRNKAMRVFSSMTSVELPYGEGTLQVAIPIDWLGQIARARPVAPVSDVHAVIKTALDHPIGSPPLPDLVRPGQRVAIIVDDYTRKTPVHLMLPIVLERLLSADVVREDICIVFALGTHRPMTMTEIASKVGNEVVQQYEIVNTPSSAQNEMVYLGSSSNGIPAWVQRAVAEADVRIGLGMITPHLDAGFTGGAKIILPGVCSTTTVDAFHARAADAPTNQLGNVHAPLRRDLEQFVDERVPLHFVINVVTTLHGEVCECVAGHFVKAHRVGVTHAREVFGTPVEREYPVVIANCYPYQHDLWQSTKGLWCGDLLTSDGGTLILLTHATEGHSSYPLLPHFIGRDPHQLERELKAGQTEDPKAAVTGFLIGRMKQRIDIVLVSDGLTQADADVMGMGYFDTLEAALEVQVTKLSLPDQRGAVCVLTHAGITLPLLP